MTGHDGGNRNGPDDTDPRIAAAVGVLNGWSELHQIDVRTVTCGCGEKLGTLLDAEKHIATEKARRVFAAADAVDPYRSPCDALCEHGRACERHGRHNVHEHEDAGMGVIHAWPNGQPCWALQCEED